MTLLLACFRFRARRRERSDLPVLRALVPTLLGMAMMLGGCDPETSGDDGLAGDTGDQDDGSEDGPPDEPSGSFADSVAPILDASCGCHQGGAGGLAFDGDPYGALLGVPANGADMSYIEPGDLGASYLVHKIRGTQADVGGGGSTMPLGGVLSEAEIATIEAWVEAGAPE